VIWNGSASGVDLKKFDISQKADWRKQIRTQLGIDENAFVYGFIGRITGDKGINELFRAYQEQKKQALEKANSKSK
jgi:glycogen synthase